MYIHFQNFNLIHYFYLIGVIVSLTPRDIPKQLSILAFINYLTWTVISIYMTGVLIYFSLHVAIGFIMEFSVM